MELISLFILALIGEAVWETLKMVWQQGKVSIDKVGALLIGILLCTASGADILVIVGIPARIPFIGIILTGILISRGSNFMHDIISSISNMKAYTDRQEKK